MSAFDKVTKRESHEADNYLLQAVAIFTRQIEVTSTQVLPCQQNTAFGWTLVSTDESIKAIRR